MQEELIDPKETSEAKSLKYSLASFDFIISLVVWHDVFFQVNSVSSTMQSANNDLLTVTQPLGKCQTFLKEYSEIGFTGLCNSQKHTEDLEIETVYKKQPERNKKLQFGYESQDEALTDPGQ